MGGALRMIDGLVARKMPPLVICDRRQDLRSIASEVSIINPNRHLMPQSHTHLRTLTESFGSNRSRPQKNEGGA